MSSWRVDPRRRAAVPAGSPPAADDHRPAVLPGEARHDQHPGDLRRPRARSRSTSTSWPTSSSPSCPTRCIPSRCRSGSATREGNPGLATAHRARPDEAALVSLAPGRPPRRPAGAGGRRHGSAPFDVAEDDPAAPAPAAASRDRRGGRPRPRLAGARRHARCWREVVVPLVAQGELIGVLNLGPRRSERPYSLDDRRLLDNLAGNAAAAIRVAHLVRHQEQQARSRARIDQELRVAQLIQQQFLPRTRRRRRGGGSLPTTSPHARSVATSTTSSPLPEGRIGLVVGDVTDKGVPAAMVMATTHSILRSRGAPPRRPRRRASAGPTTSCAPRCRPTCSSPASTPSSIRPPGTLRFANAGHNLPCIHTADGVVEPRATGMPLGLMTGISTRSRRSRRPRAARCCSTATAWSRPTIRPGSSTGSPRIRALVGRTQQDDASSRRVLDDLESFTGPGWEQEDDITLVSISRAAVPSAGGAGTAGARWHRSRCRATWATSGSQPTVSSRPSPRSGWRSPVVDRLRHRRRRGDDERHRARQRLSERGGGGADGHRVADGAEGPGRRPGRRARASRAEAPDIERKLAGLQTPRGWGLFLMRAMVDELAVTSDGNERTVELGHAPRRREGEDAMSQFHADAPTARGA